MSELYPILRALKMGEGSGGGSGTSDYTQLSNKPKINNTELSGNKSSSDLGLQSNVMTGYTEPSETSAIAATDTVLAAMGKLEKKADDNQSNISSFHKVSGTDVYYQETEPTGTIATGSYWISKNGTMVYTDNITLKIPSALYSAVNEPIAYILCGNMTQNGNPTPTTIIEPQECGDIVESGEYQGKYKISFKINGTDKDIYADEPLRKIGIYEDSIDSNGTITRKIKKYIVTGNETVDKLANNIYYLSGALASNTPILGVTALCTHYSNNPITTQISGNLLNNQFTINQVGVGNFSITIHDNTNGNNNSVTYKQYLSSQYSNNTPVTVWYVLYEPVADTITVPQVSVKQGYNTIDSDSTLRPSSISITLTTGWH